MLHKQHLNIVIFCLSIEQKPQQSTYNHTDSNICHIWLCEKFCDIYSCRSHGFRVIRRAIFAIAKERIERWKILVLFMFMGGENFREFRVFRVRIYNAKWYFNLSTFKILLICGALKSAYQNLKRAERVKSCYSYLATRYYFKPRPMSIASGFGSAPRKSRYNFIGSSVPPFSSNVRNFCAVS